MYLSDRQAKDKGFISYLAGQVISEPVVCVDRLPGSSAYNYEINHKHVLKLPNEYTSTDDWLRQSQCAPVLQNRLSFQIPIPQPKTIYTPDKKALLSSSYPKIEGICFMSKDFAPKNKEFKQRFFEQLSDVAFQIHTINPKELPVELPTEIDYLEKCFFKNFRGDSYFSKKIFRKLVHNPFLGLGESGLRTSLLAHTDLHSGNVVLNDKNELIGILDFDTMVRGDRFLEFRPNLYEDPYDMILFRKKYQERSGQKLNSNDLDQFKITKMTLRWFWALCNCYQTLPLPERNKKLKQDVKQRIASFKRADKCI